MLEFALGFIVGIGILCLVLRYLARNKSFFVLFPKDYLQTRLKWLDKINPQSEGQHLWDALMIYSHFAENPSDVTEDLKMAIGSRLVDKWKEYPLRAEKKKAYEKELSELKKKYGINN